MTRAEAARDDNGVPKYQVSYSVPAFMSGAEFANYRAIRDNGADLVAQLASAALTLPYSRIVVRDIAPNQDLGIQPVPASDFEQWLIDSTLMTANGYRTIITQQLPQTKLLVVVGVLDFTSTPSITNVRFYSGNAAMWAQYNIEKSYSVFDTPLTIVRPTLVWNPNDTVRVDVWSTVAQDENFLLDGFIAEAVGQTVAPPVYG